jgi:hypothetical protein
MDVDLIKVSGFNPLAKFIFSDFPYLPLILDE